MMVPALLLALLLLQPTPCMGADALASTKRVVDGDTIVVEVLEVYKEGFKRYEGVEVRVRLADTNAPELETVEGKRSLEALRKLVEGRIVYLDIDDVYVTDRYGRLVAVVYVGFNETHLLNVNMWLLEEGLAQLWDHPNEFNPALWRLYTACTPPTPKAVVEPGEPRGALVTSTATIIAVMGALLLLAAILLARRVAR